MPKEHPKDKNIKEIREAMEKKNKKREPDARIGNLIERFELVGVGKCSEVQEQVVMKWSWGRRLVLCLGRR